MDEEGESSRYPPRSPAGLSVNFEYPHTIGGASINRANVVHTDTIPIFVESEWGTSMPTYSSSFGGITGRLQLCPAIFSPTAQHIPQVVKHIYARLANAATQLDQGVPELLLSLVGMGCSFNLEDSERLVRGISRIVTRCGFWAVTSGEIKDPLAAAAAAALRLTLPQRESTEEETLLIVVNSSDAVYNADSGEAFHTSANNNGAISMIDSRYNTFYIIWNRQQPSQREMLEFRSCMAVNLANPPPALLIGVPSTSHMHPMQSSSSASFDDHHHTIPQTPLGAPPGASPTIILPSASSSDGDRMPLPVALFAGATLSTLVELDNYLQCGVPVLIIHDASELCTLIRSCSILYQSSGFEHNRFLHWVDAELRRACALPPALLTPMDASGTTIMPDDPVEAELDLAKRTLCRILATAFSGKRSQIAFMTIADADHLADHVLDLLVHAVGDNALLQRILNLAVKLNISGVVRSLKMDNIFTRDEQLESVMLEALKTDEQIDVLAALLDQNVPIQVTSNLLLGWLDATPDQYFFNTIVLGHLLGFTYKLNRITEYVAMRINHLLRQLSGGVGCLFPVEFFDERPAAFHQTASGFHYSAGGNSFRGSGELRNTKSIQTLAVWALLLNRTETVKILCAYAHEPAALYLVLAKVSRNLARRSREWFFYEQKLLALSTYLTTSAVRLLDGAYAECALRAYRALCHRPNLGSSSPSLGSAAKWRGGGVMPGDACDCALNRLTLAELAFEMNAREFIAHDCCQRFVLRLLYGNLQVRAISVDMLAPNWLKIVTSAIFVIPISFWITTRPSQLPPSLLYGSAQFENMRNNSEDLTAGPRRPLSPTVVLLEDGRQSKKIRANSIYSLVGGGGATTTNDFAQSAPRTPDSVAPETDMFIFGAQRTPSTGTGSGTGGASIPLSSSAARKKSSRSKKSSKSSMIHMRTGTKSKSGTAAAAAAGRAPQRIALHRRNKFSADVAMFYATPITKYWLSLVFRLAYLLLFSYTIALPSCGFLSMDFLVWIWSFMWLLESLWIFNVRLQNCSWKEMPWTIFDIVCVSSFLSYLLVARIANTQMNNGSLLTHLTGGWYTVKAVWALFLLYECYRTLFIYVPLSEVLGPLLVRIKLMVVQDFINYLILVLLVILSSAIAIKATLYPDSELNAATLGDTMSWSFLQLLTTDLAVLTSNEECQRKRLPSQSYFSDANRCSPLSGVASPKCPTPGAWPAHFTVLEYLVVLKVISWPILFALFARTAKRVDEEAERIWRYQLYALATNFAIRPFLPPPFTPLFFVALSCCRLRGGGGPGSSGRRFLGTLIERLSAHAGDHPDVRGPAAAPSPALSAHSKFSTIYRNPSVPSSKVKCQNIYWRQLAIRQWKTARRASSASSNLTAAAGPGHNQLDEKLNLLFLLNNFYRTTGGRTEDGTTMIAMPLANASAGSGRSSAANVPRNASYNGSSSAVTGVASPIFGNEPPRSEPTSPISTMSTTATMKSPTPHERALSSSIVLPLGGIRRMAVPDNCRAWAILMPKYCPPTYSKPLAEFPRDIQKYVQDHSPTNLVDVRRQWRQRRMSDLLRLQSTPTQIIPQQQQQQQFDDTATDWAGMVLLSGDGLPLNPHGRTGVAGRGDYPRFGPNRLYIYVIIVRDKSGSLKVLTTSANDDKSTKSAPEMGAAQTVTLPSRWRYGMQRADEFLAKLLFLVGVPDTDSQMLTSRAHLAVGRADARLAHIACQPLDQPLVEMTDNAWTEADVWAADLRHLTDYAESIDDNFEWRRLEVIRSGTAASFLPNCLRVFVDSSLRAFNTS